MTFLKEGFRNFASLGKFNKSKRVGAKAKA